MVDAKRAEIKKQEKASKQQAKEEAEVSEGNEADKPAE
jgi:hypothetical protein